MLLKFDPNGNFLWSQTWGAVTGYATGGGLGIDPSGHVLLAGIENAYPPPGNPALFVSSYNEIGVLLSSVAWNAPANVITGSPAIAINSAGSAAVVDTSLNSTGAWASTTAPLGTLPNSLLSNPYSLGTPTGQMTVLTNPTQPQTGPESSGGVFVTSYLHYLSNGPFLSFPLLNKTHSTAAINSIFDHSMDIAATGS
jgi:hypothetical protein